jgi:hypothetical protein
MALTLAAFTWLFRAPPSLRVAFCSGLILSTSFWVSEATLAGIIPLLWLLFERRNVAQMDAKKFTALILGTAIFVPFIFYWRSRIGYVGHDADYLKVATLDMLGVGMKKFLPQFSDMINSELPEKSVWSWVAATPLIVVNPLVLILRKTVVGEGSDQPRAPLLTFLALHNFVYFLIMLTSHHSYFGAGEIQRYWVPVIIFSIYLCLVLGARTLQAIGPRALALLPALPTAVCVLSLAALAPAKWPHADTTYGSIRNHRKDLRFIRRRGVTHVTADYWRSLPLNVLSNFAVLAVPRDFSRTSRFEPEFSPEARQTHPDQYYDF